MAKRIKKIWWALEDSNLQPEFEDELRYVSEVTCDVIRAMVKSSNEQEYRKFYKKLKIKLASIKSVISEINREADYVLR